MARPARRSRRGLKFVPSLTVLVMLGPVAAGLAGTLAPALGWMPATGAVELSGAPFAQLFGWAGFWDAVRLSLLSGVGATVLSLAIVVAICAAWQGTRTFRAIERLLSPLLSVPHAAAAFGLAFLLAPSGWIVRAMTPELTGWSRPPDVLIVQDPWGLALMLGLVVKEVPFLMLMTIAALGQAETGRSLLVGRALGYGREKAWLVTVFPRLYAQIRLPVYVVLAYSMSVVDVALILGPNTPPTLAVQVVRWMADPDLAMRLQAAAGAIVQLGLVLGALAAWRLGEIAVGRLGCRWAQGGGRARSLSAVRGLAVLPGVLAAALLILGLAGLALWSVAGHWSFPHVLPDGLTWLSWERHGHAVLSVSGETALIGAVAVLIALVLTIGCLEAEYRYDLRMGAASMWVLYLPLLVPQIAFLPGLQALMLAGGLDAGRGAVIAAHVVFVLPYVFLSLGDPFRAWDRRMGTIAAALGARPDRVLWRVRLPMLLAPVLTAAAVGFAVSVGQYLPTLLVGGGRVPTLTTEAVALASGGDRRAIGVYALVQTAAALLPFALALALPRLVWANRRGLSHA